MTGVASAYARDGYIVARSLIDPATVEACRRHLDWLRSQPASGGTGAAIVTARLGSDRFADELVEDPRLAGLAGSALGPAVGGHGSGQVACFGYTYIVKAAGTGLPALWHQDGHPWRERFGIEEALTLWIALDWADGDNGALEVLPRSHLLPARPLVGPAGVGPAGGPGVGGSGDGRAAGGLFGGGIDPGPYEPSEVELLVMAPGDVSAHHPCLIHGSGANRSPYERRGLALRYRPA